MGIDDLENLDRLENYCRKVIDESKPYGYTSLTNWEQVEDRRGMSDYAQGMSYKDHAELVKRWHEKRGRGWYRPTQISRGGLLTKW